VSYPVLVVGVGAEGPASLPEATRQHIAQADQLWGSERLLAFWADHPAPKTVIKASVSRLVERLRERGDQRVVVLASGDPGFYGIAGTLLRYLPAHEVEIIPHVTSLQLAFARAHLDWSDAVLTSAHARPLAELVGWARRAAKLGILTDPTRTPALLARTLLDAGLDDCRAIVVENLGLPEERLIDSRLSQLVNGQFAALNVMLVVRGDAWRPRPVYASRPDEAYAHRRGLITKAEVRSLSLAALALAETDTAWDVGAGSGALSVEMAELAWRGQVFAVECDAENLAFLHRNVEKFGALNVTIVEGHAPEALEELPPPQAVFVGGTGGEMVAILNHIARVARPGCRVVLNLATLEHVSQGLQLMSSLGWSPRLTQVNIAYGQALAGLTRLSPLNPVFILVGTQPADGS